MWEARPLARTAKAYMRIANWAADKHAAVAYLSQTTFHVLFALDVCVAANTGGRCSAELRLRTFAAPVELRSAKGPDGEIQWWSRGLSEP